MVIGIIIYSIHARIHVLNTRYRCMMFSMTIVGVSDASMHAHTQIKMK